MTRGGARRRDGEARRRRAAPAARGALGRAEWFRRVTTERPFRTAALSHRPFVAVERPCAAVTNAQEPSTSCGNGRSHAGCSHPLCSGAPSTKRQRVGARETIKPRRGRARIHEACRHGVSPARARRLAAVRGATLVFARVEQHIAQRKLHGARRLQGTIMVAVGKHTTATAELPVYGTRDAHTYSLHGARERRTIISFRQQMQMIRLHRKMRQPKPAALLSCSQRSAHHTKQRRRTQRRQPRADPQRHVNRMMARDLATPRVRNASTLPLRRPARAPPCTPTAARAKRQRELPPPHYPHVSS